MCLYNNTLTTTHKYQHSLNDKDISYLNMLYNDLNFDMTFQPSSLQKPRKSRFLFNISDGNFELQSSFATNKKNGVTSKYPRKFVNKNVNIQKYVEHIISMIFDIDLLNSSI